MLIPSAFEFCTFYHSFAVSPTWKSGSCGCCPGFRGSDMWGGSCYRHWTIWSFSASGSYDLTFLLPANKECFVKYCRIKGYMEAVPMVLWVCSSLAGGEVSAKYAAVTSLHPSLHHTTYYHRLWRLVTFFFQNWGSWKGTQIYLAALWGLKRATGSKG